ncbi:MAG: hypothetical protein HY835_08660 [Anaerolineae bacterium]|nr:hypothetical protein [Anaerolineae bacterium]
MESYFHAVLLKVSPVEELGLEDAVVSEEVFMTAVVGCAVGETEVAAGAQAETMESTSIIAKMMENIFCFI